MAQTRGELEARLRGQLRRYQERTGMTNEEMARRCGMSREAYRFVIHDGRRQPSVRLLLGVTGAGLSPSLTRTARSLLLSIVRPPEVGGAGAPRGGRLNTMVAS